MGKALVREDSAIVILEIRLRFVPRKNRKVTRSLTTSTLSFQDGTEVFDFISSTDILFLLVLLCEYYALLPSTFAKKAMFLSALD